jgi:C-terminal processing protease CtpA/Prc
MVDSLFAIILRKGYPELILDLRGNPGGNISAMRVASYLVDSSRFGGVFVTRKWFEHHDAPPRIEQYRSFPLLSEANYRILIDGLHNEEGIALKLLPAGSRYKGRLFVLTDRRTASSCEPLVYGIREYWLGTIVGEPTAGAMLNSEEFPLGDGWEIVIPTAEYYAADGFRIDRVGVQPDVVVKSKDALDRTLEMITTR